MGEVKEDLWKIKANIPVSVGKQTDGNIVGSLWGP